MNLIIDTGIWKKGFNDHDECCLLLLTYFSTKKNDYLVIDQQDRILKEYEKHFTYSAKKIFTNLISKGKIRKISTDGVRINKYLKNLDFDKDDHKFLEVSVALHMKDTSCIIVSADSDFTILKQKLGENEIMRNKLGCPEIVKPEEFLQKYYDIDTCL
jgi:predicted nucleic acid-binding protein